MAAKRKIQARFLQRGKWCIAWTDHVPGALTQGRSLEEARENLRDAVRLMREPLEQLPAKIQSPTCLTETLTL